MLRVAAIVVALLSAVPAARAQSSQCPDNFAAFSGTTDPLVCSCTAEQTRAGSVWGMDVYTGDSAICRAAQHAGAITPRGGEVTVIPMPARRFFPGVTRRGIASSNYGPYDSSFRFGPGPEKEGPFECPDDFGAYKEEVDPLTCSCSGYAATQGSVWGSGPYTGDSAICRAARHAGAIPPAGGMITVTPAPGQQRYPGTTRNSIASSNFGEFAFSYQVGPAGGAPMAQAPAAPAAPAAPPPQPGAPVNAGQCPDNFATYAGTTDPVACTCTAEQTRIGSVWGTNVYTADSGLCRAAQHAGAITARGGDIVVIPLPARRFFYGLTRNGIASNNYGPYDNTFRFGPGPERTGPQECPDNFAAFKDELDPLPCTCSAQATTLGSVWGSDIYTGDSGVCRAARHAGYVGPNGGPVTVVPAPGQQRYPGMTRNNISSSNFGPYASSFRFDGQPIQQAPPPPPPRATAAPVQQNVQQSLRERGQVDLYIQFRFNSADLELSAADTLMELLAAIRETPGVRLALVGHTDAVGTPQYNLDLSYRRAESVRNWLVSKGADPRALLVDGKGMNEPIADNATEQGRATNRRVQALRLP
ncbi:outer membrane porin F precursor [Variibacter gotjawalensis]|uniref:Outer membrane porin F n=1 Tax=Variibacter gotjawalensis TaxID=1333996 RepID=A0A0S3PYC8_9BRAD|nr:LCCL domain-containing protein [Variibacter gotjawalensis]NIK46774.1 outer membrane protein OmpA-like peptidoglycan-associated protein [Variibacter gotjawalensis]RZS48678.1 outer membrane protein OmpA-like peptidoglycan-associated protein [Variibacter gotjawalensis]BAT60937.1 outer membrane porin F precursor [Variibacter gotjawalensis]